MVEKTTISINVNTKKIIDKMIAVYHINEHFGVLKDDKYYTKRPRPTINEFVLILLNVYQDHIICLTKDEIDEVKSLLDRASNDSEEVIRE